MITVNGKQIELMKFPNGETRIKLPELRAKPVITIDWKFESDAELFQLMTVVEKLKHDIRLVVNFDLIMPYVPYSRMDRVEDDRTLFTLKTFCNAINLMGFDRVYITEPHSDVCVALLNNVMPLSVTKELVKIAEDKIEEARNYWNPPIKTILVFPDLGASKRYGKMFPDYESVIGYKKRDFETGKITHMEIIGKTPEGGFNAIIVDDLSSYGGTFLLAGNALRVLGANTVVLCVTHCENSIYDGELLKTKVIDYIITTDSILSKFESEKIIVVK